MDDLLGGEEAPGLDLDTSALVLQSEDDALRALRDAAPLSAAPHRLERDCGGVLKPRTVGLLDEYQRGLEAFRAERAQQRHLAAMMLRSVTTHSPDPAVEVPHPKVSAAIAQETALERRLSAAPAVLAGSSSSRVPANEALLHVALHVPSAGGLVSEEWLLRGDSTLGALRDVLFCLSDLNAAGVEAAENASRRVAGTPLLTLSQPSAFFYLEGTFYSDTRAPSCKDCSAPLRQHLKDMGHAAPPHPLPGSTTPALQTTAYSVASMDAKIRDLWLRAGPAAPALYCHQGGCEHVVTIKDVRRFDPDCDPPFECQYPLRLSGPAYLQQRSCQVCTMHSAKYVTYDDRQAPASPYFWCPACFRAMHYDETGTVLYTDFKVFPYQMDYHNFVVHGSRRHH